MSLTAFGSRAATEPEARTEARAAGVGPTDSLASENGKVLSSADNGVAAVKLAVYRADKKNR